MQFISGLGLDKVLEDLRRLRQVQDAISGSQIVSRSSSRIEASWISVEDVARSLLTGRFAGPEVRSSLRN
jgi:hypothetical protein